MSRDDFESERYRVERVIDILEHAATRLEAGDHIPLSLLTDAVAFINRSEEAAYEAMLDEDEPALSQCLEQHTAVSRPLAVMQDALAAFAGGEKGSAGRFARAVAAYVQLRREHLAADDRLFREPRGVSSPSSSPGCRSNSSKARIPAGSTIAWSRRERCWIWEYPPPFLTSTLEDPDPHSHDIVR